jgi:hypothetical protein
MPARTNDTKKSVKAIYDEGMAEVMKIVGSIRSTPAQKKVALETSKDLTTMLLAHTVASIEGRTALLTGLIVELTQVTESIKVKPPYAGALTGFGKIIGKASKLFDSEKKKLLG